jgi:hypothetical protein
LASTANRKAAALMGRTIGVFLAAHGWVGALRLGGVIVDWCTIVTFYPVNLSSKILE